MRSLQISNGMYTSTEEASYLGAHRTYVKQIKTLLERDFSERAQSANERKRLKKNTSKLYDTDDFCLEFQLVMHVECRKNKPVLFPLQTKLLMRGRKVSNYYEALYNKANNVRHFCASFTPFYRKLI